MNTTQAPTHSSDLLDLTAIQTAMAGTVLSEIELLPIIDSTNTYLLTKARALTQQHLVCLTEQQTQGRGQHGRSWVTPVASSLAMSVLWPFQLGVTDLTGFSLVIGVAIAEALTQLGFPDIQLKWPNDIVHQQKKLGGILIETLIQGQSLQAVIGIGLNVSSAPPYEIVKQPVTCLADIATATSSRELIVSSSRGLSAGSRIHRQAMDPANKSRDDGKNHSRNAIVIALLQSIIKHTQKYTESGFAAFLPLWERYDVLYGKQIVWYEKDKKHEGVAMGIAHNGALQVDTVNGFKQLYAGELSVKLTG